MPRTRKEIMDAVGMGSLLDLPRDVFEHNIATTAEDTVLDNLSATCKTLYLFSQPELDKRGAEYLLKLVLHGEWNAVVNMAKTNPKLFFIKSTAMDYAMDLEKVPNRRTIKDWSPYQALFGTGNVELLEKIKPFLDDYLATLDKDERAKIQNQEQEKFPDGFDFPPCTDKFNELLLELVNAISQDQQLSHDRLNPNAATVNALAKLKSYLKPGIVQSGHHFNMNDFIKTHEVYNEKWVHWSPQQLTFFRINVIGFQQRLLTAFYLDVVCTGLENYINNEKQLEHTFEVETYDDSTMKILPFHNEDPAYQLGKNFFLDSYNGGPEGLVVAFKLYSASLWRNLSSKHCKTFENYAHTHKANVFDVRNC